MDQEARRHRAEGGGMSSFSWVKSDTRDLSGPHYSVFELRGDGMEALRDCFPTGKATQLQQVLFSTSGVHGSYTTIEDIERGEDGAKALTFLIIQPRLVCMRYGIRQPTEPEDFEFLKALRASSSAALGTIGKPS
jgi:hypothetical protein